MGPLGSGALISVSSGALIPAPTAAAILTEAAYIPSGHSCGAYISATSLHSAVTLKEL